MISIIIPVYNQAKSLIETLNSINAQTYNDYEVIVVNDGSSDGAEEAFEYFLSNNKVNNSYVFLNQKNGGAPMARNRGLEEAKGDYLFFCDADATLVPEALATMVETIEQNPNASYVYSSFRWGHKLFKVGEFSAEKLKQAPYIHTMSLIRRSDFPVSKWDENLKRFQDWDIWLSMLAEGHQGLWINKVLFKIKGGGTMSLWMPSLAYKVLPFLGTVKRYKKAMKVIKEKHGLN